MIAGPSRPKTARVENRTLASLRASLELYITTEIKQILMESQRVLLRMLKSNTEASENGENEQVPESESTNFYTLQDL